MNRFLKLFYELKNKYGEAKGQWELWCKRPKTDEEREEVIIGAILTQRTNWKNVEKAIENLKKENTCDLRRISLTPLNKLSKFIKPSGFYKVKSQYLFNLANFLTKNYLNLNEIKKENALKIRELLLKLKGIGFETADSILLYAFDKPVFVIDEYTKRLIKKKKLSKNFNYDYLQKLFEKNLKKDYVLFQDFHALIVIDGKTKKL